MEPRIRLLLADDHALNIVEQNRDSAGIALVNMDKGKRMRSLSRMSDARPVCRKSAAIIAAGTADDKTSNTQKALPEGSPVLLGMMVPASFYSPDNIWHSPDKDGGPSGKHGLHMCGRTRACTNATTHRQTPGCFCNVLCRPRCDIRQ